MIILNLIFKEIKQSLRDKKAMSMMVLFPIVLIVILGTAFSKTFGGDVNIEIKAEVAYTNYSKVELTKAFDSFKDDLTKELKVTFKELPGTSNKEDTQEGIEAIKNGKYSCYIVLSDNEFKIYKNERFNFEGNLLESVFNTFVQRYNLVMQVAKVNPAAIEGILSDSNTNYTSMVSLEKKKQPRAMDYYAVTMITLIIMYATMTGSYSITGERTTKTESRMVITPVTKYQIFIGKAIGCVLVTVLQILIVFLFSKYVLKINWGDNILVVLLILFSEIVMAISLGTGMALITKNESASNGILNALVPIMIFLGGGYVPLDQFQSKALNLITQVSPIKWTNEAILKVIYSNDMSTVAQTLIINFSVILVFMFISIFLFRREEA